MALYLNLYTTHRCMCYCLISVLKKYRNLCTTTSITEDVDAMDNFTTQLMQQKCHKWEITRNQTALVRKQLDKQQIKEPYRNCSCSVLDANLASAIEQSNLKDIKNLIENYQGIKRLPSVPLLLEILNFYVQNGHKEGILQLIELYEEVDLRFLEAHGHFEDYLAGAMWVKGNINEAMKTFDEIYRSKPFLRRNVRLILKYLICDSVTKGSEATVVNIMNFCKRLDKDFRDLYPLSCIWQVYILSDWFSDQNEAIDLLYENEDLCNFIMSRIPYVVFRALRNHRVEIVYRLLELLLSKDKKDHCGSIIIALFDYKVSQGDLRACAEIIRWSKENDINLPTIEKTSTSTLVSTKLKETPDCTYKF